MGGSVPDPVGSSAPPHMHTCPLTLLHSPLCLTYNTFTYLLRSLFIACPACPSPSLLSQPTLCQWLQHPGLCLKTPSSRCSSACTWARPGHPGDAGEWEVVDQSPHLSHPLGGRLLPRVPLEAKPCAHSHLLFHFLGWLLSLSCFTSPSPPGASCSSQTPC